MSHPTIPWVSFKSSTQTLLPPTALVLKCTPGKIYGLYRTKWVYIQVEKKYEDHKISGSYCSQFDILGIWNSETFCQIKDV